LLLNLLVGVGGKRFLLEAERGVGIATMLCLAPLDLCGATMLLLVDARRDVLLREVRFEGICIGISNFCDKAQSPVSSATISEVEMRIPLISMEYICRSFTDKEVQRESDPGARSPSPPSPPSPPFPAATTTHKFAFSSIVMSMILSVSVFQIVTDL
jgi:hypothetical protein